MKASGVPCVPGSDGALPDDDDEVMRDRQESRLPGHPQGGRRRRRTRHARGAYRGRAAQRGQHDQDGSPKLFWQSNDLHGKVSRKSAPYRDPGAGRRAWQRDFPRRARLLHAAPPPESAGRSPCAGPWPPSCATRSANAAPKPAARSATAARAPSNSCTKTANSSSSR